jgi:hypothetical protein
MGQKEEKFLLNEPFIKKYMPPLSCGVEKKYIEALT